MIALLFLDSLSVLQCAACHSLHHPKAYILELGPKHQTLDQ